MRRLQEGNLAQYACADWAPTDGFLKIQKSADGGALSESDLKHIGTTMNSQIFIGMLTMRVRYVCMYVYIETYLHTYMCIFLE